MTPGITEIKLNHADNSCIVIAGPTRRAFFSTPRAVAMALLDGIHESEEAATDRASRNMNWTDLLATHGTLFGQQGQKQVTAVVLPRKERSVIVGTNMSDPPIVVSYPPTLLALLTVGGRIHRGMVMLADVTRQAQFGVIATQPLLTPFPYGNIYNDSGYICWGTVRHSDIRSIQDLEALFFGSGFNHDLWNAEVAGMARLRAGELPTPATARFTHTFPQMIERLLRA